MPGKRCRLVGQGRGRRNSAVYWVIDDFQGRRVGSIFWVSFFIFFTFLFSPNGASLEEGQKRLEWFFFSA
jgi:hypothetical protein